MNDGQFGGDHEVVQGGHKDGQASDSPVRMPAAERRELILHAATVDFAERGCAGATTGQVAKAAPISQPDVVRMSGTKEQLFLEALDRALGKLMAQTSADLIQDRGILLLLMQSFLAGLGEETTRDFLAHGMLMNTLISLRMTDLYGQDGAVNELLECTMGAKLDLLLAHGAAGCLGHGATADWACRHRDSTNSAGSSRTVLSPRAPAGSPPTSTSECR